MSNIGPVGGDPYRLSKLPLNTGTTSANPNVVPPPNPNVVPKKPPANDEFISRGLGPTLPKQKINDLEINDLEINDLGWESLEGTELAPAKSDLVTSRQPIVATKKQKQDVTTVLAKHMGPDTSRLLGIMGNFA
jgi:hypothetical protein